MFARSLLFVLLLSLSGCATAPPIGVRSAFKHHVLAEIALAPIASAKPFGMSESRWRLVKAHAIRRVTEDLDSLGFRVVSPEALRDSLERANAWERFEDAASQPGGLEMLFEPNIYAAPRLEVQTLRELYDEGTLVVPALLFTDIVYHSRGICTVDPREHSRFARVSDRTGDVETAPEGPCIVTHVQAKLVDPQTGGTMWHNRFLRELRVADLSDDDEIHNVEDTVEDVVGGNHGLAPFAPALPSQ